MALLDNRVAIVTGGGRGIGREHCLELAHHGARVVVVDSGVDSKGRTTREEPADSVVREIMAAGGEAIAWKGSVTDWISGQEIIQATLQRFGHLDVVINNAGILRDRMITSMTEQDFDDVVDVHLKGTFVMSKHACDHWRGEAKAGRPNAGRIINTTSGAGLYGNVGQSAYAAAKAGIIGLTLTTALEMARYDVTANVISPVARTRMSSHLPGMGTAQQSFDSLHPRAASPVVAYLASEASNWISGQVLRVEGGTVIRMEGWRGAGEYGSGAREFLDAADLVTGMRVAFGTFPAGLLGKRSDQ